LERTRMRALAVALGIAVWLAPTAATVEADGRRGQARGDFRGSPHFGRHHHHHHHHRGFLHRPFFPLFVGPSVVVTSPVVVTPPPAYSAPPMIYGGPSPYAYYGAASVPPPPPPAPRVVEFPTGRYELRGDGVYSPYSWVWIPNAARSASSDRVARCASCAAPRGHRPGVAATRRTVPLDRRAGRDDLDRQPAENTRQIPRAGEPANAVGRQRASAGRTAELRRRPPAGTRSPAPGFPDRYDPKPPRSARGRPRPPAGGSASW
jgi:hypothetical protein